ncbi:MAG: hypothetical protein RLY20_1314 [Verrucomicrobiota bacterium]
MGITNMKVCNVLVVDDEPYVCDALKMLLALDGHKVATASNGEEALTVYGRECFDLVITDYSMPVMKGDELAKTIKSRNPDQRILMVSAYVEALTASGSRPTGVDALMAKPFRLEQLRAAMSEALA